MTSERVRKIGIQNQVDFFAFCLYTFCLQGPYGSYNQEYRDNFKVRQRAEGQLQHLSQVYGPRENVAAMPDTALRVYPF